MTSPAELVLKLDLLILTSPAEKSVDSPRTVRCLELLNRWLEERNHSEGFWEVSSYAGGTRPMGSLVFAASFYNFYFSDFLEHVRELPWQEPERVQVLVRQNESERFAVFSKFIE